MQEQQQQHLKAMLGPRGQLAYYGLRLPHQQQTTTTGLTGVCPTVRAMMVPTTLNSIRHSLFLSNYQNASPGVPSFGELSSVSNANSTTPSTASTATDTVNSLPHLGPAAVLTSVANATKCSAANTSNSTLNCLANSTSNNIASVPSSGANNTPVSKAINTTKNMTGSMVDSVSSSTSNGIETGKSEAKITGRGQESGSGSRKTPPPPSRMVTRSQTAAVRTPVCVDGEDRQQNRGKSHRRSRSCGEKEGGPSPRKLRLDSGSTAAIGLDDFPFAKNPAGAGIEFGAVCGECGAVAVTGTGWNAHQGAHRGEGAPCSHCTQVFLTTHGRDAHQQLHREGHSRDVDDYCECSLCGGSFIGIMYLELHLLELHGRDALYDQRALHLGPSTNTDAPCSQEDESGRQLFRCGVCQSLFTFSLNLDCHMALHTEVSYACALCDAAFPSLDPLVTHSRAHRFAGIAPTSVSGMPMHMSHGQVPVRRPTPVQRPTTPFSVWGGLQQARTGQHTPPACPTTPIGVPLNSTMSPAMLNYYMMMSLWGGDKANTGLDNSMWANYLNPAMTSVFNYINPYLLNNNNAANKNNVGSKTDCVKNEQDLGASRGEGTKDDPSMGETA